MMHCRRRVLVAIVALGLVGAVAAAADPVDVALVLAVDVSGSVDADERAIQRGGYVAALGDKDFLRAVRAGREGRVAVAYFEWSDHVHDAAVAPWTIIEGTDGARDLAAAIAVLPVYAGHGTSIARALDFAAGLIEDAPGPATRRVIDVSGDGPNNMGPDLAAARDRIVRGGVTINGLPLVLRPSGSVRDIARYYQDCVIGGEGAFIMAAHGSEDLARAIRRKLILEISGLAPPPRLWPAVTPESCEAPDSLGRERPPYFPGLHD